MFKRIISIFLFAAWSCAALWPPMPRAAAQASKPVVVIVSAALGNSDITLATLRHAFEGYATDLSGTRLIPFNQAIGTPARSILDKAVLGLEPDKVASFWIDRKIRQSVDAPRALPSPDLVLRVVATLKGAIGYTEASPSSIPSAVRVLSIDGKAPSDPNYPLSVR